MLFQSYLTKVNGLLKSGFHKYVEEGQNIDEMAQEVDILIESFGEDILEHIPIDTLLALIKLFLAPMPSVFWQSLRSHLDPIPIPIEN